MIEVTEASGEAAGGLEDARDGLDGGGGDPAGEESEDAIPVLPAVPTSSLKGVNRLRRV